MGRSRICWRARDSHPEATDRSLGDGDGDLLFKFLFALAVAVVAGYLGCVCCRSFPTSNSGRCSRFAAVLLLYAFTHAIGGTALFAVMAFGAALANLPDPRHSADSFVFRILPADPSRAIHSFHAELAFLVRSFFFVLLGVLVDFSGLQREFLASLGIVAVLVCRPSRRRADSAASSGAERRPANGKSLHY